MKRFVKHSDVSEMYKRIEDVIDEYLADTDGVVEDMNQFRSWVVSETRTSMGELPRCYEVEQLLDRVLRDKYYTYDED